MKDRYTVLQIVQNVSVWSIWELVLVNDDCVRIAFIFYSRFVKILKIFQTIELILF